MKVICNSPLKYRASKRVTKHTGKLVLFASAVLLCLNGAARANVDAPAGLSGSINGNELSIEWNAVSDASGYNVYVNNNYLTTTQATQYATEAVDGEVYNFYVTAFTNDPVTFSGRSDQLTLPESAVPDDLTIPPSVPQGLTGSINGTVVSISWEPSTDDEAVSGYNVYQNNQYLTTVFDTQYSGSVIAGQTYAYTIVAFDTRVNFSAASERLTLPDQGDVDTTIPPSTPTGLDGVISASGSQSVVELSWKASTDDQAVAGYNVYENDAYKTTVFNTQYSGTVTTDEAYSYYVVAFDFDGNFSQKAAAIVLPDNIVIVDDVQAPSTPANLTGTWDVNGSTADVTLSWDESTDNNRVAGYNIYENKAYLTTVSDNTFSTTVNAPGSYSYSIVAFDVARNFSGASISRTLPNSDNIPPEFIGLGDQTAFAGADVNILIRPTDVDGGTPGLFIGNLPEGMESIDNLNGSRTLFWRPLQPDVGDHSITVTAFDSVEPNTVQTVRTFTLTIEMPEDPTSIRNEPPIMNLVNEHIVRIGDTVVMEVKVNDANGTEPSLSIENLPTGATFVDHSSFVNVKVLRWTTTAGDAGLNTLNFRAVDSEDSSLFDTMSASLNVVNADQFVRSGERLRTLAEDDDLLIGYASLLNYFNRPDADLYQDTAASEFNLVTPENSMKWGYINPQPGEYRFAAADALVQFASDNNMKLHGHTLVWYTALPQWVVTSDLDEREAVMNEYIDTLTQRYNTVDIWDVVNEAFEDDGSYRNSTWFQAMGKDYIEKAFRRARAGAPSAKLIYNDYDIAYGDAKTDATFSLMEELQARDVPIDGIGFQMHVGSDFTAFNKIENTFQRFANLGLDIYITEMDVRQSAGTTEDDQADVYKRIVEICLDQSACKAIQTWGVTDRYTWLTGDTPLMFDRNYQPKPAYTAVQEALDEH